MKQVIESRSQTYKRITDGIRKYVEQDTADVMRLIQEAKRTEIWKEKWSSWREYCENEFGKTPRWAYQLLEVASTIDEIQSVKPFHTESGKNKEILHNLNTRQAQELKGLPPSKKAKVLAMAIAKEGGKSPNPETIASTRAACSEFSGGTYRGHDASDFYIRRRDEIDPADKMPASTKADVALAREASDLYPKKVSFELLSRAEEDSFVAWSEGVLARRGHKNGHAKLDMRGAIRSVCDAYNKATGRKLSVKPMDAGQLHRLLESGITLEEFIEVGEKAWVSNEFWARGQSHQLCTFVKQYGNIRKEVDSPKKKTAIDFQKEAGGLKGQAYAATIRTVGS